jgi:hypothetical protein
MAPVYENQRSSFPLLVLVLFHTKGTEWLWGEGGFVKISKFQKFVTQKVPNKEIERDYQQVFSSSSSVSTANLSFLALL